MRKLTTGSSMLVLAAALTVGACSGGSNRDSTAGMSGGEVGGTASTAASASMLLPMVDLRMADRSCRCG